MNSEAITALLTLVLLLGFVVGWAVSHSIESSVWQHQAIEHHAAHYDATTAKFTWNDEKAVEK